MKELRGSYMALGFPPNPANGVAFVRKNMGNGETTPAGAASRASRNRAVPTTLSRHAVNVCDG